MMRNLAKVLAIVSLVGTLVYGQERIHWDAVQKIRAEAFQNSKVMEFAGDLTDIYGPRLANSPSYKESTKWAKKAFESFGITDVEIEPYGEFGVSWQVEFVSAHMTKPQYMPIIAYPNTWCRGTNGEVRGNAVHIDIEEFGSESDLKPYKGKLPNAIVFIEPIQDLAPTWKPLAVRYSEDQLDELARTDITRQMRRERRRDREGRGMTRDQIVDFLFSEGAAALAAPDGRENYGTVLVNEVPGKAWESMDAIHPPFMVLAAEHYNRVMRLLNKGVEVELLIDMKIAISDRDRVDHNVIANLPGSDLSQEVVMLGAHLDANSAGTGATDNASGVAVVIEAMRILKAAGLTPRRTIRAALWGGEEYGLVGSKKYIEKHFGGGQETPVKPGHKNLVIYLNKDGGAGKIRGIHLQGNEQLRGLFTDWLKPLHSLGATHLTSQTSGNSDHAPFNAAGLPAVSFLQDPVERRAYHTNMDTYDRLIPEDLVQSAIVMAVLSFHAAMRDEKIQRIEGPK
jgi:hypothetical protein